MSKQLNLDGLRALLAEHAAKAGQAEQAANPNVGVWISGNA